MTATTTCQAAPLALPHCGKSSTGHKAVPSKSSKADGLSDIPKNLRELLTTSLLEGQPVNYMRKGK